MPRKQWSGFAHYRIESPRIEESRDGLDSGPHLIGRARIRRAWRLCPHTGDENWSRQGGHHQSDDEDAEGTAWHCEVYLSSRKPNGTNDFRSLMGHQAEILCRRSSPGAVSPKVEDCWCFQNRRPDLKNSTSSARPERPGICRGLAFLRIFTTLTNGIALA